MEEILEKIASAAIDPEETDDRKTVFKDLYKNTGRLNNQEERRKNLLENQKSNRNIATDTSRGILEIVHAVESNDVFGSSTKAYYRPNIYVAGFVRAPLSYHNVLMNSEWMIEKPSDFNQSWYVVPCPKGLRVLLVASQGKTKLYNKFGKFKLETKTLLPGGCSSALRSNCCVLDGFYNSSTNTMYVLDILAWNNQPMTDGETEFRDFWLKTQVFEIKGLDVLSKSNKLKLILISKTSCEPEEFNKFMMTYPAFENSSPSLDGLLFYHKNGHYVSGQTPLVLWLYPYMVQEVLGSDITVHESYNAQPNNYANQAEFIRKFEEKHSKNKQHSEATSDEMQTEEIETDKTEETVKDDMEVADGENNENKTNDTEETKKRGTKRRKHLPDGDALCDVPVNDN